MKEEKICIEITDPASKTKKHFKSKKNAKNDVVISAISENEFTTTVTEEAFGLSTNGISKRLQKEIQATVDETYKSFKDGMKEAVLNSLGFERDWGGTKWKVDHCNGRMSTVTEHISHLARDFFREVKIENVANTLTDKDRQELHSEVVREVKNAVIYMVRDRLNSQIYEVISATINDIVTKAVEEEIATHKQKIKDTVKKQLDSAVSDEDFEPIKLRNR